MAFTWQGVEEGYFVYHHSDGGDQVCADPIMHSFLHANSSSGVALQPKVIVVCPRLFQEILILFMFSIIYMLS